MEEQNELPVPRPAAPRKTFPAWSDLLLILLVFLGTNLLAGVVVAAVNGGAMTGLAIFLTYTLSFAVTIAFALKLARMRGNESPIRLTFKGFYPTQVLWGLILMLAMSVVIEPVINLFPKEWYDWVDDRITNGGWAMFTAVVMAPVCEEIFFRGILQKNMVRKWGPVAGILIASAIFGLIHGIPQQVVAGFCLGIVIGWVYWRTGSLVAAMVLHAINNALSVFLTLFESEEIADRTVRQIIGNDTAYTAVYAVCALLLIGSLLFAIFAEDRRRLGQKIKQA